MTRAVVLGASGALGSAVMRRLLERGVAVRAVGRDAPRLRATFPQESVEIQEADPFNPDDLTRACAGAETVYLCLNMAYPYWDQWPGLMEGVLAATGAAKARLVFPTNIYALGRQQGNPVAEDAPRDPHTKKGRIRARLEDLVLDAHRSGTVPGMVIRLPDFYGPGVRNTLMDSMFAGAPGGHPMLWPGDPDLPHELIFIEDAAEAVVRLGETAEAYGKVWHVPGPATTSAHAWAALLGDAIGKPVKIRRLRTWQVRLAGLLDAATREFVEMLYLWQNPIILDGSKYLAQFGPYPATPYPEGINRTLAWFRESQLVRQTSLG